MPPSARTAKGTHTRTHLPRFASFILEHHETDFVGDMLQRSKQANIPLLKHIDVLGNEQLQHLFLIRNREWLTSLANNSEKEHLKATADRWAADQLPHVEKNKIVLEDVTLIINTRRQSLLAFIPAFTNDLHLALELVKEIDSHLDQFSSTLLETFVAILNARNELQSHLNKKITDTVPGIIFIYDAIHKKEVYTNRPDQPHYTSSFGDLNDFIHPEDRAAIQRHVSHVLSLKDTEVSTVEYRYRMQSGNWCWHRTYESIFKRTDEGNISQTIGISFDISSEKQVAQKLQQRESQLLEAQHLAGLGSFEWNLVTGGSETTTELYRLLDLREGDQFQEFLERVHPQDQDRVRNEFKKAIQDNSTFDYEFRYIGNAGVEKVFWAKGTAVAEAGKRLIRGTVLDITQRHRTFEKLKESEGLFKQAQSLTHIGNYTWDLLRNKLTWSDELYRIYGLDPQTDKISDERAASLHHPDDFDLVRTSIRHAQETLNPFDFHYRIILPGGRIKILHARGEVRSDETRKPLMIIGTAQDVTERQHLVEKLQHSDRLYKQAQSLARIGNWEWDIRENKVTWSDELFRIFGLEPKSTGNTFESYLPLVHPDDTELVRKETMRSLEEKKPNDFYHRIIVDGRTRILHARSEVKLDNNGFPLKLIGTAQDVTEQKETEQQLIDNQNFIRKIANAAPSVIASYNINTGKYVFVSEGIKKMLGHEPQRVIDEGAAFLVSLIHPDDVAPLMQKNSEALARANESVSDSEIISEFQYRIRHVNGEYRWIHTYGSVFSRDHRNQVELVLNISIDISERMKAEQVLYQRTLELQQSNANLEEFAFVTSHDLKEPLRKISTFSDRLLNAERENVSPEGLSYLQKIMGSSLRLQQMISDLLSLSLINGDKGFRKTQLKKLWDEVIVSLETKIEDYGAKVICDELPEAVVVPSQFRQLFQNLLSNSLKFSRTDVRPVIQVSFAYMGPKEVEALNLREALRYLKIIFIDNGIGFDNVFVEKMFAIFQRLHTKERYEGTGIGLSICKKIAENHGGIILANGLPGKGATFTVIIPA